MINLFPVLLVLKLVKPPPTLLGSGVTPSRALKITKQPSFWPTIAFGENLFLLQEIYIAVIQHNLRTSGRRHQDSILLIMMILEPLKISSNQTQTVLP
jgi:hypothetical protein